MAPRDEVKHPNWFRRKFWCGDTPYHSIRWNVIVSVRILCVPHVERICAWEDKCKRLLLRFEHMQQRHFGMKLMAYTLMNLRAFCGV